MNGIHGKKAALIQTIKHATKQPEIIHLQETHCEASPNIPGYRSYASSVPKSTEKWARVRGGVCTLVKKGLVYLEHDLKHTTNTEHLTIEVVVSKRGKRHKEHIYITNIYTKPKYSSQRYGTLIRKIKQLAKDNTTLICGDFNAQHTTWGYQRTTAKGRNLLEETQNADYHLINDISTPYEETLGSDHCIIEIIIPLNCHAAPPRKQKLTDWNKFRASLETIPSHIDDIEEWTEALLTEAQQATTEIETDEDMPNMDSRLAHLLEARDSLKKRWKKQRHNRKLRKRIALLNREIEKHCAVLCRQQWHAICQEANGQIHKSRAWRLLLHLLDDSQTKGTQQYTLARTLLKARKELGDEEVCKRLNDKYLPATPPSPLPSYTGDANPKLDADIEEWEVRAIHQKINSKSAAGPDGVSNKALRNLSDGAITALTKFFNERWRSGTLPPKWKEARTVLIPKPDFLTDRTTTIVAGDLELPTKKLGSTGTPQGAVISPTLFNLVMIGMAERLRALPKVKHIIYADDITLWMAGGSDGEIEASLQQAIDVVEEHLEDTGLQCSPAKSELLLLLPRRKFRAAHMPDIQLRTKDGTTIPRVHTLRVLGLHIEELRYNGHTVKLLDSKVSRAISLIKKISTNDSRTAVLRFAENKVHPSVVRVCGALRPSSTGVCIKLFPAHMGMVGPEANRNEDADRMASALTRRNACPAPPPAENYDSDGEDFT
ncbi:uncharacterized protein LOC144146434 [Haemaphysalis longicornis]